MTKDRRVVYKRGKALETKNLDEAIEHLKKALALNPNDKLTHYNLGLAYDKKGMLQEAVLEYEKAIAIDHNNKKIHNNLGLVFEELGRYEEAISQLEDVLAMDPDYAGAHYNLGLVYGKQGSSPLAANHFYKAGILYLEQGDRNRALAAYRCLKLTKSIRLKKSLFKKLYYEFKKRSDVLHHSP